MAEGLSDSEQQELRKWFMETCVALGPDGKKYLTLIENSLGIAIISYIQRQLNPIARMGALNDAEYGSLLLDAETGLFALIYYDNYPESDSGLAHLDPIWYSSRNLQRLLANRVLNGKDRELVLAEYMSRRPLMIQPNQQGK